VSSLILGIRYNRHFGDACCIWKRVLFGCFLWRVSCKIFNYSV